MMVRGGGLLSRWAGASQGGCALQWARSIAGASSHQQYRPFSTKKQPDDFVDPAAKEEFDQIMGAIESGRSAYRIKRSMLPKPERALSKLRGVNAVFGAGAGGGAGAAGLDTPHPEGDEVAAELPSLGVLRTAVAKIPSNRMADAATIYRDLIAPAYRETKGFKGGSLAFNREALTMHSFTFWESDEALAANNANPTYQQAMQQFAQLVTKPPHVEKYTVCCDAMPTIEF